jgi:XrtJ-associated TM-motif-TM protein
LTRSLAVGYFSLDFEVEESMKLTYVVLGSLLCFIAVPAFAQGGCVNSPENPTAILALVGTAGGFVVAARSRFGRRK